MTPAHVLPIEPGDRVLDICAAPGGKSTELAAKLKGKGVLTEADINEAMREVKLALLEADVNFKVVKSFVSDVKEKCMGSEVLESLTPTQ